jgi:hypothetical protein
VLAVIGGCAPVVAAAAELAVDALVTRRARLRE